MAKQATITNLLMVALIAVIVGGLYMFVSAKAPLSTAGQGDDGRGAGDDSIVSGTGIGYATTVQTSVYNAINKTNALDARGYLYYSDNKAVAKDVALTSAVTSLSATAPNSFTGYAMIGNDANQGTDGGVERYYKRVPVSYSGAGYVSVSDEGTPNVEVYSESTSITWTGYDDNTAEATTNITVGTSPVTTLKLKMEPTAGTAIGNPQLTNPLGVCFNVTTTANWNEITPRGVTYESFATPEVYKGNNIIGCYRFTDTAAIADDKGVHRSEYTYGVTLDPASNPDEFIFAYPMEMTYYLNDKSVWEIGFADNSLQGTDYDPGINGLANAKLVHAF